MVAVVKFRTPLAVTREFEERVSVWATVMESVWVPLAAPTTSESRLTLTLSVTVYVPSRVMRASSPAPGTPGGAQFPGTSQLPPEALFHVKDAACAADGPKPIVRNAANGTKKTIDEGTRNR